MYLGNNRFKQSELSLDTHLLFISIIQFNWVTYLNSESISCAKDSKPFFFFTFSENQLRNAFLEYPISVLHRLCENVQFS